MTVYARSDVAAVGISREHGGCGETHARPVVEGAPAKVWALTCHGGCEDHLRGDPLWGGKPHEIPETPDEVLIREDAEKRGSLEQQQNVAAALTNIAKLGDVLPTALAHALAAALTGAQLPAQALGRVIALCPDGHQNVSDARFCVECGRAINPADRRAVTQPVEQPPVIDTSASADDVAAAMGAIRHVADETGEEPVITELAGLDVAHASASELRRVATDLGLPTSGTKDTLVDRITRRLAEQRDAAGEDA